MTNRRGKNVLESVPKDTGWAWMCCFGFFIANILSIGGVIKCFSIMYVAFMYQYDAKAGHAAWIVALCGAVQLLSASYTSALSIRFTNRAIIVAGGVILSLGFLASMLATNVYHLYLTYGIILGLGCSLAHFASLLHVGQYFEKRRATANGLGFCGVGAGNLIFPVIFRTLLDIFGLRGTFLIMAGISLNTCVAGMLMRPISAYSTGPKEEKLETTNHNPLSFVSDLCKGYKVMEWSLLKEVPFILFGITLFFYMAGNTAVFVSIGAYVEEAGHSKTESAYIVSAGGAADIVGRMATGFIADLHLIPTHSLMGILALVATTMAAILPFVKTLVPIGAIFFIYTLSAGPIMSLTPVFLEETFGPERIASGIGIVTFFLAAGLMCFPIAGTLRDVTGNWNASFFFISTCLFITTSTLFIRTPIQQLMAKRRLSNSDSNT